MKKILAIALLMGTSAYGAFAQKYFTNKGVKTF